MENKKENIDGQQEKEFVVTKEYLSTCIRGTFKDVEGKCKFREDENGCFYLDPLSGEMYYVTDSGIV